MTIAVGLIGYGLGGRVFHAPLIEAAEGLRLAAVATSRPVPVGVTRHASPEALIADPSVDLVVIATPNPTHFPLARSALETGKHVVIDKPFTVTAHEAAALIALAEPRGLMLAPFHNRRWDGDFLTVQALLASGALGDLLLAEMFWDRFRPDLRDSWKDGAAPGTGVLYDLGPHLIDQALLLFGRPDAVGADIARQRPGSPVDDYFDLILYYPSLRVRLGCSAMVAAPRPRFALHGTRGSFVKHGLDPQEEAAKAGMSPASPGFGRSDPALDGLLTRLDGATERVPTREGRALGFYEGVAAAILHGAPAPVAAADALLGLRIIEAAYRSAAEGRVVGLDA